MFNTHETAMCSPDSARMNGCLHCMSSTYVASIRPYPRICDPCVHQTRSSLGAQEVKAMGFCMGRSMGGVNLLPVSLSVPVAHWWRQDHRRKGRMDLLALTSAALHALLIMAYVIALSSLRNDRHGSHSLFVCPCCWEA